MGSQCEDTSESRLILSNEQSNEELDKEETSSECGSVPRSPPPHHQHTLETSENLDGRGSSAENKTTSNGTPQVKRQEIVHKSSKEFYKAVAAQWGITCKMSDHCRCLDCQSRYFDCEYDRDNELEKTDGGLAAGTPMFISEVMHGSVCHIL